MPTPDEIKNAALVTLREVGPKLGSQLGALIQARFPDDKIDFKTQFGGLARFLKETCADQISVSGTQGLDLIFSLKGTDVGEGIPSSQALGPLLTPWRVFVNPAPHSVLIVSVASGSLRVGTVRESCAEGEKLVPSLSPEDHKQMIREFVGTYPTLVGDNCDFLDMQDYWTRWSVIVRGLEPLDRSKWLLFRKQRITEAFVTRVRTVGLDETAIRYAATVLTQSSKTGSRGSAPKVGTPSDPDLRALIQSAIAGMSGEQLRQLWLPIGLVIDAVEQRRTSK